MKKYTVRKVITIERKVIRVRWFGIEKSVTSEKTIEAPDSCGQRKEDISRTGGENKCCCRDKNHGSGVKT